MNKLFTKIAGVMLGFAMAIGVGVAVAGKQDVKAAHAADTTYSLTPNQSSTGSSSASYITTLTEFTYSGVKWKMNQWNPKTLQIKTNQSNATNEFRFYNTTAFSGKIKQVVLKFSALTLSNTSNTGFQFLGGSSEVTATTGGTNGTWNSTNKTITWTPSDSTNYTYFGFYQNGKVATGTNNLDSSDAIVVTYEASAVPTKGELSITPVEGDKIVEGKTGTFTYSLSGGTQSELTEQNWASSDSSVLEITNAATGAYKAVSAGNATVTLTGTDASEFSYTVGDGAATYAISVIEDPFASFTLVTSKSSLSTNKIYALSNDGEQFSNNVVDNKKMVLTRTYSEVGFFALEEVGTDQYNIRFATKENDEWDVTTGNYINHTSDTSADLSVSTSSATTWTATENNSNGVYLLHGERYLGINSDSVKAYKDLGTYPAVYLYEVETIPTKVLSSIELSGTYPTAFKQGDAFSHEGMVVTANYEGGSTKNVTASAEFSGYNMATAGEQEVTVSYTEGEITKTAKYNITISESIVLAGENFAMQVGDADVAPVIKIKDTSTVVEGCTLTTSNANVASIVNNKVHAVAKGTATITAAHADANNKTYTSATFTVTVVDVNTYIEDIYDMNDNDPIDVYGYYAGKHSDGIILMDGEYGIIVYKASADTTWTVDETIIHVTGTRTSYNGLVEIKNGATVTKVSDQEETILKTKISVPTNYSLTGAETSSDSSLSNRRTFVSGELTNIDGLYYTITTPSSTNLTVYLKAGNDNNVTYHDEDGNEQTAKLSVYLASMLNKNVTVKGFTSIFGTYFQVLAYDIVEADNSFTVELFAQMILDETDGVCKNDNTTDLAAITAKWNKLGGEEGWEKLSTAERAKFQDHDVTPNYDAEAAGSHTVLENALGRYNVICKRYFQNNNFANRYDVNGAPVTPTESNSLFGANESNEVATIVVLIAIASISAFGCLLILKKRKHQ